MDLTFIAKDIYSGKKQMFIQNIHKICTCSHFHVARCCKLFRVLVQKTPNQLNSVGLIKFIILALSENLIKQICGSNSIEKRLNIDLYISGAVTDTEGVSKSLCSPHFEKMVSTEFN